MRKSGKCPKCESTTLIEQARVVDRGNSWIMSFDLSVAAYQNPDALLFKGEHRGTLAAWICTNCGFTELYCVELM